MKKVKFSSFVHAGNKEYPQEPRLLDSLVFATWSLRETIFVLSFTVIKTTKITGQLNHKKRVMWLRLHCLLKQGAARVMTTERDKWPKDSSTESLSVQSVLCFALSFFHAYSVLLDNNDDSRWKEKKYVHPKVFAVNSYSLLWRTEKSTRQTTPGDKEVELGLHDSVCPSLFFPQYHLSLSFCLQEQSRQKRRLDSVLDNESRDGVEKNVLTSKRHFSLKANPTKEMYKSQEVQYSFKRLLDVCWCSICVTNDSLIDFNF